MLVKQAYKKYKIPPNLQKHMLWVTAVAKLILDNWIGKKLNKNAVIYCCLFHDAAKIINFDFTKTELFENRNKISYWKNVQTQLIRNYGKKELSATIKICKEISLSKKAIQLIEKLDWSNLPQVLQNYQLESAITIYSDMRIGPNGLLSIKQRINELQNRVGEIPKEVRGQYVNLLENKIQKKTKLDLNKITKLELKTQFKMLLNLQLN